jgi:hypothetical protein
MPRMRRRNTTALRPLGAAHERKLWDRRIRTYRPGFAPLSEPQRRVIVAALARHGYSARLIGRVVGLTKSAILGISWRSRTLSRNRVRLLGRKSKYAVRNRYLLQLPWYPNRYK